LKQAEERKKKQALEAEEWKKGANSRAAGRAEAQGKDTQV